MIVAKNGIFAKGLPRGWQRNQVAAQVMKVRDNKNFGQ